MLPINSTASLFGFSSRPAEFDILGTAYRAAYGRKSAPTSPQTKSLEKLKEYIAENVDTNKASKLLADITAIESIFSRTNEANNDFTQNSLFYLLSKQSQDYAKLPAGSVLDTLS